MLYSVQSGGVPERLNGPDSKSGMPEMVSEVRILPPPLCTGTRPPKEDPCPSHKTLAGAAPLVENAVEGKSSREFELHLFLQLLEYILGVDGMIKMSGFG